MSPMILEVFGSTKMNLSCIDTGPETPKVSGAFLIRSRKFLGQAIVQDPKELFLIVTLITKGLLLNFLVSSLGEQENKVDLPQLRFKLFSSPSTENPFLRFCFFRVRPTWGTLHREHV